MSSLRELPLSLPRPLVGGGPRSSPRPASEPRAPSEAEPTPFARLLGAVSREADAGDRLVRQVLVQGPALDSAHLLALQVGIYRYGETVDLAARLVDKASSAVKTVLQGQ